MSELSIATVAFNAPWAISEQIRLFKKFVLDDYELLVFDNSDKEDRASEIKEVCGRTATSYVRLGGRCLHHDALNNAANNFALMDCLYYGFVDHDVFPTKKTRIVPLVEATGFYGIGQRHGPTNRSYLWPGFMFLSRQFINGRSLDFEGIRGTDKREDGDTGSGLYWLFEGQGWEKMYRGRHGYSYLREPDDYGLQSFGYEWFEGGTWLHLTNTSGWMAVPDGREELAKELVCAL